MFRAFARAGPLSDSGFDLCCGSTGLSCLALFCQKRTINCFNANPTPHPTHGMGGGENRDGERETGGGLIRQGGRAVPALRRAEGVGLTEGDSGETLLPL